MPTTVRFDVFTVMKIWVLNVAILPHHYMASQPRRWLEPTTFCIKCFCVCRRALRFLHEKLSSVTIIYSPHYKPTLNTKCKGYEEIVYCVWTYCSNYVSPQNVQAAFSFAPTAFQHLGSRRSICFCDQHTQIIDISNFHTKV